ncbi:MAG: cation transporter [Paracoccus sp. (in: a-proteobacteria)]|uniref:heavy-metal-associated domain-containing protein n=1 Tax=Paracoccus sp. TaxID=267 RepID=UPI0026E10168|nr:cation transporter [Paracoccus sp. (in: a-proteobacteria)]MDO5632668.1 cation transporter [Paracoccus sp. (in: a-proteobacteria)]
MLFKVEDMTCGHCKAAIEKAVTAAGGDAVVDLDMKTVDVQGLDSQAAEAVIRDAGYTPQLV